MIQLRMFLREKMAFLNNQKIRVSKRNKINECLFASSGNEKT